MASGDDVPGAFVPDRNEVVIATRTAADGSREIAPTGSSHGSANLALHEADQAAMPEDLRASPAKRAAPRPGPSRTRSPCRTPPSAGAATRTWSVMKTNETIGVATLLNDGTLVLELRADGPARGDARFTYAPTAPHYAQVKRHLGDVKPGQTVPVRPFS